MSAPARCPRCGQPAPTVVRGLETFCVACGAPRFPLASVPVNLAGRPAKVGGSIARVLGWLVLASGLGVAAIVGALLQVIFPAGVAGWIVGGVLGAFAAALGVLLLVSAKKLSVAGTGREREAAVSAIAALAARQGGALTAEDAARALGMPVQRADDLLTDLAKQPSARVRLEVDDSGQLLYYVDSVTPRRRVAPPRARVASEPAEDPLASVDEESEEERRDLRAHRRT